MARGRTGELRAFCHQRFIRPLDSKMDAPVRDCIAMLYCPGLHRTTNIDDDENANTHTFSLHSSIDEEFSFVCISCCNVVVDTSGGEIILVYISGCIFYRPKMKLVFQQKPLGGLL